MRLLFEGILIDLELFVCERRQELDGNFDINARLVQFIPFMPCTKEILDESTRKSADSSAAVLQ